MEAPDTPVIEVGAPIPVKLMTTQTPVTTEVLSRVAEAMRRHGIRVAPTRRPGH